MGLASMMDRKTMNAILSKLLRIVTTFEKSIHIFHEFRQMNASRRVVENPENEMGWRGNKHEIESE